MAPLTVVFLPESAYGPTNQCIGLGNVLLERGHRVVFAAESSWGGRLAPLGFDERLIDLSPPPAAAAETDAGAFWAEFIAQTAPEFRKPTIEQLATFIRPTFAALIDGARYAEPALREILADVRPDVVVEDNVVLFPALKTCGAAYVRVVSCNPLELPGPAIPPAFSGLPSDDPASWPSFRGEFARTHRELWAEFNDWVVEQGAASLPDLEFMPRDNTANLYVYPAEADYAGKRPLDPSWHRMDSSVRQTEQAYVLPDHLADRPRGSKLVYLSLGSLGGADLALMQRLVDVLADSPHRFVVSMGPLAERITLAPNMAGAAIVPQTTVLPQVDAVITHAGNNTTTEALHFGKPMVLLPLFWDQHDNAQRMHELGFGVRLPTYSFTDGQLHSALDRLLGDHSLLAQLAALGRRVRARDGLRRGADVIESAGRLRGRLPEAARPSA